MIYLEPAEKAQLDELQHINSFVEETLVQCERILSSRAFTRVHQETKEFLQFVVAKTLLERNSEIKEVTIAISVFHDLRYDTAQNAKVRVAAANLRKRLTRYYATEGQNDVIDIVIPKGTYVPTIIDRRVSIAVGLFDDWGMNKDQDHLCVAVRGEIVHRLRQYGRVQVSAAEALGVETQGCQYGLRGSLVCQGDSLKLNVSLIDLSTGHSIYDERFEGGRAELLRLSVQIADAVMSAWGTKRQAACVLESTVISERTHATRPARQGATTNT